LNIYILYAVSNCFFIKRYGAINVSEDIDDLYLEDYTASRILDDDDDE
jgi:hypothetical protein